MLPAPTKTEVVELPPAELLLDDESLLDEPQPAAIITTATVGAMSHFNFGIESLQ